jgi:hypothetical protein
MMNRFVSNRKCLVFCLLSFVLGVLTALGAGGADSSRPKGLGPELGRALAAAKQREAEEAYEKRNAESTSWAEESASVNPGNAALLYYQAFLLRPEPSVAIDERMHDIFIGDQPSEPLRQVKAYLGRCLPVMEAVEMASQMRQCTWGLDLWPEHRLSVNAFHSEVSHLSSILLVDAKILAADGRYHMALERCLTVRRLAGHLGDDSELDSMARSPDRLALITIQHVLGVMAPDANILKWLRAQLAIVQGPRPRVGELLRTNVRDSLSGMRKSPTSLQYHKNLAVEMAVSEQVKDAIRNLTDEQFLSRAREELERFLDAICRVLDSEMTYEQKLSQIHGLISKKMEEDSTEPLAKAIISVDSMNMKGNFDRLYPFQIGHVAHADGIKAAVEVYLVVAKTGQLPEKLPSHLPKDPFTGQDFGYEITDEGFALRCQGEDFRKSFLEFKVRR